MTMICRAKNKAELKAKLEAGCDIQNPTPFGTNHIDSRKVEGGWHDVVVLDPETRRRFAQIAKRADGTWSVK